MRKYFQDKFAMSDQGLSSTPANKNQALILLFLINIFFTPEWANYCLIFYGFIFIFKLILY